MYENTIEFFFFLIRLPVVWLNIRDGTTRLYYVRIRTPLFYGFISHRPRRDLILVVSCDRLETSRKYFDTHSRGIKNTVELENKMENLVRRHTSRVLYDLNVDAVICVVRRKYIIFRRYFI